MNHYTFDDPAKETLWAALRALNDTWTRGNPDDLAGFFHPQMVAITATDRHRREGAAACIAGWKGFAQAARIHHWRELDPVIHLYGDAAVVAYEFDMSFEHGRPHHQHGRTGYVLFRQGGRSLVGGGRSVQRLSGKLLLMFRWRRPGTG